MDLLIIFCMLIILLGKIIRREGSKNLLYLCALVFVYCSVCILRMVMGSYKIIEFVLFLAEKVSIVMLAITFYNAFEKEDEYDD